MTGIDDLSWSLWVTATAVATRRRHLVTRLEVLESTKRLIRDAIYQGRLAAEVEAIATELIRLPK